MSERYLKLSEVQRMLSVSRATVWRWQAERGLRVVSVGGVKRIRESDLQGFLRRHEEGKPAVEEGLRNGFSSLAQNGS